MEPSPLGGGAGLAAVRPPGGRPVRQCRKTLCAPCGSHSDQGTSLLWRRRVGAPTLAGGTPLCLPPPPASASAASQSQERQTTNPGCGPGQSECQVVPRLGVHGAGDTLAPPGLAPDADSGPGSPLLAPNPRPQTLGLEAERGRLLDLGLPSAVVSTIQGARAPSTVRAYRLRWQLFATWCAERRSGEAACALPPVLSILLFWGLCLGVLGALGRGYLFTFVILLLETLLLCLALLGEVASSSMLSTLLGASLVVLGALGEAAFHHLCFFFMRVVVAGPGRTMCLLSIRSQPRPLPLCTWYEVGLRVRSNHACLLEYIDPTAFA
ncbi:hypothetical protein WMY93_005778 [Mugilogobius chulae]|uniref:Uncharacterized protein n=1 Tax=Mugilogobius chulae TaxID=88201 RepID=A0AAW0PP69_9GOBI